MEAKSGKRQVKLLEEISTVKKDASKPSMDELQSMIMNKLNELE